MICTVYFFGSAKKWRLDVEATAPADCEARGVADPKVLPNYPYRDDATRVYQAIRQYVQTVVTHFYGKQMPLCQCSAQHIWILIRSLLFELISFSQTSN